MSRKRRVSPLRLGLVLAVLFTASGAIGLATYAEVKLSRLVVGGLGESFSTRIYSAPAVLGGLWADNPNDILKRLRRLDYESNAKLLPGQYVWSDPVLTINLRGFSTPFMSQAAGLVHLTLGTDRKWAATDADGHPVSLPAVEPEVMAELSGPHKVRREPANWEEIPKQLSTAVVAVEDRRFYSHHGIDLRAIARAAWFNVTHGRKLQGGSTITQQLAKNLFLTQQRTLRRKIVEAGLALYLDLRYPKDKILTLYLNHIYLGQDGFVSVAGVKAAARFYFDKDLKDLTLPESALLAGLIRSPYRYNPFQNPDAARGRRNTVLALMAAEGDITPAERDAAESAPLPKAPVRAAPARVNESDYFVAEVVRRLLPRYSEDMLYRYGLRIYTTMDPLLQSAAFASVRHARHQCAIVMMEPGTGRVLALIGGRDYAESQFNRATQARRQPGSAFKPFVYGAGVEENFTPATLLVDRPRAYTDGKGIWAPQNFDGVYHGSVTVRQALAHSMNAATLDLASKIGAGQIIRFANKMGITSPLEKSLAIALGSSEVVPLEITAAYAPFANGGSAVDPFFVSSVVDAEDQVLELNHVERRPVLDPAVAFVMTSLLESTISDGTARNLPKMGWTGPAAGKTGTTNDGRDAWFIGYTPELLTGVWVGDDADAKLDLTGAKDALPIWASVMTQTYADRLPPPFDRPQGLVTARIDPISGLLARSGCPTRTDEVFVAGTEPTSYCPLHAGGLKGWFQHLFRRRPSTPENAPTDD